MSNLGFKLLRAGFVDEASELAKKALSFEAYHSNITDLLKRLKEVPEEEGKKQTEALEKAKPKAAFYRQLADAALAETPTGMGNKWQASEAMLDASLDGRNVRIWGSYEQDENAVAGLLGGLVRRKVIRQVQYSLKLRGNVLVGEVKRTTDGETSPSTLALGLASNKVVMYFQTNGTELRAMKGSSLYTLKRVD